MPAADSPPFVASNRREWTALVRPPAGYRVDAVLGTTFSLDFVALTALLLGLLDQDTDERSWRDDGRLLQALTRLGERVRVLVNRARIPEPRLPGRLLTLYDRILAEIHLPDASFHPKVWVMKYVPRGGASDDRPIYRALFTSRNATEHSAWELAAVLEGQHDKDAGKAESLGRDLSAFFRRALHEDPAPPRFCARLVAELPKVAFRLTGEPTLRQASLRWQWPGGGNLADDLPERGSRALVVSPFVNRRFLELLIARFEEVSVVARQAALDEFWGEDLTKALGERVWVIESGEGREEDADDEEPTGDLDAASEEGAAAADDDRPLYLDLHAKLLLCETRGRGVAGKTEAWLGSANATMRGWGLPGAAVNAEAMLRFSPGVGVDAFIAQFVGDPKKGLYGWMRPYRPVPPPEEDEAGKRRRRLQKLRDRIAGLPLSASWCEKSPGEGSLLLTATRLDGWVALFAEYAEERLLVRPLAFDGRPDEDLRSLETGGVAFEPVALHEAGQLFVVILQEGDQEIRFCLTAALDVPPAFWDRRRTAFLRAHLGPQQVRQFLLSILLEGAWRPPELLAGPFSPPSADDEGTAAGSGGQAVASLLDELSLETVLESCTADLSRVEEIDDFLRALEGTGHVDKTFLGLWRDFHGVVERVEKERPR